MNTATIATTLATYVIDNHITLTTAKQASAMMTMAQSLYLGENADQHHLIARCMYYVVLADGVESTIQVGHGEGMN